MLVSSEEAVSDIFLCSLTVLILKYKTCGLCRVAQTRGAFEKVVEDEYEMSKPLARYADDEDLEKMLKERTRDGDPMLLFMKKSKAANQRAAGHKGERERI